MYIVLRADKTDENLEFSIRKPDEYTLQKHDWMWFKVSELNLMALVKGIQLMQQRLEKRGSRWDK
jgi:hypothetical protein